MVQAAGLGYAMPGTVLALGLIIPLAALDNHVDAALRSHFGISSGLLLSGSLFVIVLAYTIRFLAVDMVQNDAIENMKRDIEQLLKMPGAVSSSAVI